MTEEKLKVLPIAVNGEYKNLNLKMKYERDASKNLVIKDGAKVLKEDGLDDGEYIIVEKLFAEGMPFESKFKNKKFNPETKQMEEVDTFNFSCKVKYYDGTDEHEVSFWINDKEHEAYKNCGGEGDKVKIINIKESYINKKTGDEGKRDKLNFVKVD